MDEFSKLIRRRLRKIRRCALTSLRRSEYRLPEGEPIISFTFDDFPRSALETGGAILRSHGAYGTYYAAMGLMGRGGKLGEYFCAEDLRRLLAEGHELGSHTFSHLSCRAISLQAFQLDAQKGLEAIAKFTGRPGPHHFAYPFGHVTLRTKSRMGARMNSCRGVFEGINVSPIDLNLLYANNLYDRQTDLEAIERLIRLNDRLRGWLILYTHDVKENPSPFGSKPSQFEAVVMLAKKFRARILTVGAAIERLLPGTALQQLFCICWGPVGFIAFLSFFQQSNFLSG